MVHIFRLVLRQLSEQLLRAKWRFVQLCFPLGRVITFHCTSTGQRFLSYIPAKLAEKNDRSSTGESAGDWLCLYCTQTQAHPGRMYVQMQARSNPQGTLRDKVQPDGTA